MINLIFDLIINFTNYKVGWNNNYLSFYNRIIIEFKLLYKIDFMSVTIFRIYIE